MNRVKGEPTLKDLLDSHKKDILLALNANHIGTITKFDPATQTADIEIAYGIVIYERVGTNKYKEKIVPYPKLRDVPIKHLRGGKSHITMPIKAGDDVHVTFNDRDYSNWYEGSYAGRVKSFRLHSLSDAIGYVGLSNLTKAIANYDADNIEIANDKAVMKIKPTSFEIKNDSDSLGPVLSSLCQSLSDLSTKIAAITVTCANPGTPSSIPINNAAILASKTEIDLIKAKLEGLLT